MDLAETFEKLDETAIKAFVAEGQEEHLHLDFKTVTSAHLSHKDDKRNLAKALSGFANSDGGLIVWGVDARKNAQDIDCAGALVEISPIQLFVGRLNELTGQAVSPLVDGVRHKAIATTGDRGFAVSLIPESASGPHMAKLGEDRYYKRSGASFYKMEHFDLEDMFGRRQKPNLQLQLRYRPVPPEEFPSEHLDFNLVNLGRSSAHYAGFHVSLEEGTKIASVSGIDNVSHLN